MREVFDLNPMGTILRSQIFGELVVEKGEDVILNIPSMTAMRPLTRVVPYSAANAVIVGFAQWLLVQVAQEYSPRIRVSAVVNSVAPGFFLTRQNRSLVTKEQTGELTSRGKAIISHTPVECARGRHPFGAGADGAADGRKDT
jgi:NAD(P)-dependent dehydrogenase (short-subunit alcohol dehydrogenase family)